MVSGRPGEELLRFDRVALTFPSRAGGNSVEVIQELDLTVRTGEFVAVIGPSGCGKSTLLSLLAGYLMPSSGQVLFRGKPICGPGRERMMVFQQPALFRG
jgi:NitT/TauT family transport system ATP-binding protein